MYSADIPSVAVTLPRIVAIGTTVVRALERVAHEVDAQTGAVSWTPKDSGVARLAERVGSLDPFSREARTMQRWFFASGSDAELDKQGRMVIPVTLLTSAAIGREVTVAGVNDHLEIWDRAAWREQQQTVEGSAEDVAERLAKRD